MQSSSSRGTLWPPVSFSDSSFTFWLHFILPAELNQFWIFPLSIMANASAEFFFPLYASISQGQFNKYGKISSVLRCLWLCVYTGAPNHHSQSTLRPPLPPPHNSQALSHHQTSANSLNRNTLSSRRNPVHVPPSAPGDAPTTPESVQLQDSWVLNSNVPLETRSGLSYFDLPFSYIHTHTVIVMQYGSIVSLSPILFIKCCPNITKL